MEESDLIRSSRQGDVEAFNALVARYQNEALNFAFRMLGNLPDAEDICQDAWLAAWKSIKKFRGGSFRSWILHIVANDCRDEWRKRKKRFSPSEIPLSGISVTNPQPYDTVSYETIEAVQEALQQLPYEQRLVVILKELNGLSYDEIARFAGCDIGTVRSRLHRGRIMMRNRLQERGFLR